MFNLQLTVIEESEFEQSKTEEKVIQLYKYTIIQLRKHKKE